MINNTKILWIVVAIVAVISVVGFFNGRTVTQVIQDPLGAIANPYNVGNELGINGVNQFVVQGTFRNATTSVVTFQNPLAATSTVDLVLVRNTGVATSSYTLLCGPSLLPSQTPTVALLTSDKVSTSTNFNLITNNLASAASIGGLGGGTVAKAMIGPSQYFNCFTSVDASNVAGITNANETLAATYWVRFVIGR